MVGLSYDPRLRYFAISPFPSKLDQFWRYLPSSTSLYLRTLYRLLTYVIFSSHLGPESLAAVGRLFSIHIGAIDDGMLNFYADSSFNITAKFNSL